MTPAFDLFKEDPDGTVHWLCAVSDLEAAKQRAQELMLSEPGKYFVFSQATEARIYVPPPNKASKPAVSRRAVAEYSVFECLQDGSLKWCADVAGLIKTRRKLRELVEATGAEYFAIQLQSRAVIFHSEARRSAKESCKSPTANIYASSERMYCGLVVMAYSRSSETVQQRSCSGRVLLARRHNVIYHWSRRT